MAAGLTYTPIASVTLSSSVAEVSFNSFSGYTDLVVEIVATATGTDYVYMRFNAYAGAFYQTTSLSSYGTTTNTNRIVNGTYGLMSWYNNVGTTAGYNATLHLNGYETTGLCHTLMCDAGRAGTAKELTYIESMEGANFIVNSLQLYPYPGVLWAAGSTFNVYGILAA